MVKLCSRCIQSDSQRGESIRPDYKTSRAILTYLTYTYTCRGCGRNRDQFFVEVVKFRGLPLFPKVRLCTALEKYVVAERTTSQAKLSKEATIPDY